MLVETIDMQREKNLIKKRQLESLYEKSNPRIDLRKLLKLRTDACFTQDDMTKFLKLKSRDQYCRREKGQQKFTAIEIYKMMQLFGINSLTYLIKEDDVEWTTWK